MKRGVSHKPRLTAEQVERARRLSMVYDRGTVAEMLGASPATIRAAAARGWKPAERKLRPVPNDWGIVAPGLTMPELARHYRASQSAIARWLREKPVARAYNGGHVWQPPENFASLLEQHSANRVARMLGVHPNTVKAARYRLGIHPTQVATRRKAGWAERFVAASQVEARA
ncbi:helix-turn-helix domain-containing protein [Sphingomonas sp. RRHST34]|uniref:Helix-turn-helix domain-containing protein n=1 Tax=Sphingomonas citri TaxID=2862499 RepID=A0ABS7BQM7_9SPHN|nr:helix-turn-helix domain-containing protein [Sphingomonas citri]MBW6531910.1 helix-turn-helix domain-containing protein [Sphingomonas citri]